MSLGATDIHLMTLNVYFGTDLEPAFSSTDLTSLVSNVGRVWAVAEASDFPARAGRIASAIAAAQPDVLALQELVRWSFGPPSAMEPRYDFLSLVTDALRSEGISYTPLAIRADLDQMAPVDTSGNFIRMEDRHALLLRSDPPSEFQALEVTGGDFRTLLEISNPVTGPLKSPRSWIAADLAAGANRFRVIESHIESYDPDIQLAQTREIIEAAANTDFPLIFIGDLNSNANRDPKVEDFTPAYPALLDAGFQDAWQALNPDDLGNTCCHAANLRNTTQSLTRRIDVVLTRGAVTPISAQLVLADPSARTASGVWPTDHAGIVATMRIGR